MDEQSGLRGWVSRFLSHDSGPLLQFIKYGIAGGAATVTHIVLFFLVGWKLFPCLTEDDIMVRLLGVTPMVAESGRALNAGLSNGVAFMFSNAVAYILNVLFVFKPGRHHWAVAVVLFYLVSGVSMSLGTGVQTLLIAQYDLTTTVAFVANLVAALLINYAMRRFVIFNG